MPRTAPDWQARLRQLADAYGVPGASLGILQGEDVLAVGTGVTSLRTGVEVTPDTVFQIGSITKVWTATLILQLVDDGHLDLDEPVVRYLPDFRVADDAVSGSVTTRHLLCHSSGIDGDLFLDTGRGDDCIEKYVGVCASLRQIHPLGATMSYCNSGYTVLGRLVEVLRGRSWDAVLRERLFQPLQLDRAGTLPEEALLHRAAVGHIKPPDGQLAVAPVWGIFRSAGPAGLIHATAAEVLAFAQAHLRDGAAPGGRVLSATSARAMREPQVAIPDPFTLGTHWGLGWILMTWDGQQVYGHDGSTIGQAAFLRVLPQAGVAACLLTNGGRARELFQALFGEIFRDAAGVSMPDPLEPPSQRPAVEVARYAGSYAREGVEIRIESTPAGLRLFSRSTGALASQLPQDTEPMAMVPVREDVFVARRGADEAWTPAVFFRLPDGSEYLHMGARATPKVG